MNQLLPVDDVPIENIKLVYIVLGKSIFTREQLEDFVIFSGKSRDR
jgi:hypothetical protein